MFLPNLLQRRVEVPVDASIATQQESQENSEENRLYLNPTIGNLITFLLEDERPLALKIVQKALEGELRTVCTSNYQYRFKSEKTVVNRNHLLREPIDSFFAVCEEEELFINLLFASRQFTSEYVMENELNVSEETLNEINEFLNGEIEFVFKRLFGIEIQTDPFICYDDKSEVIERTHTSCGFC